MLNLENTVLIRLLAVLTLSTLSATAMAEAPRAQISGDKIHLNKKVHFEYDSEGIRRDSTEILRDVATLMNNQPSIKVIEIRGHTDANGSMSYNQDLSQRRADEVARFLIENGVEARRVRTRGYGESRPLIDGSSPRADEANRRVEFIIVKRG